MIFALTPRHIACLILPLFAQLTPLQAAPLSPEVNANPGLMKLLTIEAVASGETQDSLRLSARVELDQQRVAKIGSAVTGRITEIHATLGQTVKKGQQLATLNSTELSRAQSDYLKAASQVNLKRMAAQRAGRLFSSGIIAEAQLQERQTDLNEAEVDLHAAADQLRVMGMTEADVKQLNGKRGIHSFSPVTASIDGVVIERNVTLGQVVQPADSLYTVADLSRVWIVAEVPEQQAHWARQGDQAEAEIPALPNLAVKGKLIYVADLVNPETRTVTVRMALPNTERLFKPQMLATLKISKHGVQTLTIPSQAVVRDSDNDYVFVQTAANRFALRGVQLGAEDNARRPVLSGLQAGDKIVTSGAFHLNSERLRSTLE